MHSPSRSLAPAKGGEMRERQRQHLCRVYKGTETVICPVARGLCAGLFDRMINAELEAINNAGLTLVYRMIHK